MLQSQAWCRETYEQSVTSGCWECTPLDAGWDADGEEGQTVPTAPELREILEEEAALGFVPEWAAEVARRMIGNLPMCGHYSFPSPVLQICEAIREQQCPDLLITHYTADPERKRLMSYYIFCLDAWSKGAPAQIAQSELKRRDSLGKDWEAIVGRTWAALGEASETKLMLVERLVHRLRWWVKTLVWPGDRRDQNQLDFFGGDVRGDEKDFGSYGNPPFGDPYFAELRVRGIRELSRRITEADQGDLLGWIEHSHLCAPKAFRHLEKLVVQIGQLPPRGQAPPGGSVLECEADYPDFSAYREWYRDFMAGLDAWLEGESGAMRELGECTPVAHWLARMLRLKLEQYEQHNAFGRLVGARPAGRSGAKRPEVGPGGGH